MIKKYIATVRLCEVVRCIISGKNKKDAIEKLEYFEFEKIKEPTVQTIHIIIKPREIKGGHK